MIGDWPLLTIVTFLPLFGALFLLMIRGEDEVVAQNARHVSLWQRIYLSCLADPADRL